MKFGLSMVAMKDARFIDEVLAPFSFLDKKIVMVSSAPWGTPGERIDNSALVEKLRWHGCKVYEEYWETEEDQRNACLDMLGDCDFSWIVDTDEIYQSIDVLGAMEFIGSNQLADVYYIAQDIYWKTRQYRVEVDHWYAGIAVVKNGFHFADKRNFDSARCSVVRIPESVAKCAHMSYVGDDSAMLDKLRYNGHREEFANDWFERVWRVWTPDMVNLHPGRPDTFRRAVPA